MMDKWDLRFMDLAKYVSAWSKDPEKQVGAIIARDRYRFVVGYNGFPEGVEDLEERLQDPRVKLGLVMHAELNAVLNAAKNNFTTKDCTVYVTYHPCHECAKVIAGAGIVRVVCPQPVGKESKWFASQKLASDILYEAGVTVHYFHNND